MKIKYIDELEQVLKKFEINKNEICIIGSSVLAHYGIRENHDVDFALHPVSRVKLLERYTEQIELLSSGTINFSKNVQSLQGRYKKIGLLDEELFDDTYSLHVEGYRVAKIEVEIAQKIERNLKKDRGDLDRIEEHICSIQEFDNELFEKMKRKRKAVIFGAGANARIAYYCYCARFELVCFIDNNMDLWGDELYGLKVCSPDVLNDTDAVIIISSWQYAEEIKKEINAKYGRRKIIEFSMKEEYSITGG